MKNLLQNKKILISLIAVCVIVLGAIGGFLYYSTNLHAVSDKESVVSFEVVQGESANTIVDRLKAEDVIKNAAVTKLYMKLNGVNDLKAGKFKLDKSWSTKEIMKALSDSRNAKEDEVKITFKEGMWAKDIASVIQKELGIDKAKLLALWNDDAYITELMKTYPFLTKDVLNSKYKVKLEGYLFPETYTFKKDSTAQDITTTFLDHFATIYEKYKVEIEKSEFSIQEVITFASILQYEARTPEDMKNISKVFYNRLAIDMPLQSSVTVCYALYDKLEKPEDCELNSTIDSPYNTYLHKGMPIGPILNPGEIAIKATLEPGNNDFLYFVADVYGDGKVHYAKTLQEHEANVDKYNLRLGN